MQARKTIGILSIVAVTALIGAWLYALAGSSAQLRLLVPLPEQSSAAAPLSASPSTPSPIEGPPSLASDSSPRAAPAATVEAETAEALAADEALTEIPAGPIDAATFAKLVESGLLEEGADPSAAEALRNAVREAAEATGSEPPE